jgi:hypothetical protein
VKDRVLAIRRLAVRQLRVAAPSAYLLLAGACGAEVHVAPATECYRFDQAYFHWIWRLGRRLAIDSSALIELQPTPLHDTWTLAPGERTPLEVRARGLAPDSITTSALLQSSFWRPLSADSIELWWYDGLSGPTFRLARRHDSLVGVMDFKTDYVGAEPPRHRETAVRVRC